MTRRCFRALALLLSIGFLVAAPSSALYYLHLGAELKGLYTGTSFILCTIILFATSEVLA